ncbi:MAG TPA: FkbM family methyltransferase [Jiangellaceae bacterium]
MADGATDYQRSARYRRHSWYGTKPLVKRLLAQPGIHTLMRGAAAALGDRIHCERLPAPARLREVTATMAGVTFVMLRPDRCIVAKELYWGDGRRPRPEDQFALDVFAALARDARLVLDVGAYTGVFSLVAARVSPEARVHAFEVVPDVAHAAQENVAANGLTGQVTVHSEGIGSEGDTVVIAPGTGGSALPDFYSTKLHFANGVPVDVRSLDAFVAEINVPPPAVVKIDVEGTENVVLEHAQSFLASHRPDILCEILLESDTAGVQAALAPHGYRFYRVERGALSPQPDLVPSWEFRDWLFTPRSSSELAARGIPVA